MVTPRLETRIEKRSTLTRVWIYRLDFVALVSVANGTSQPEVILIIRTAPNDWHDVIYL